MYWVHWNTRNARLARKSLAESRPATGRKMNPVRSKNVEEEVGDKEKPVLMGSVLNKHLLHCECFLSCLYL